MLTLRLTLAAPPLALLLRLLLLCASTGIGLLLLATLSYALDHPEDHATALLRLLWCTVPLAVTAQLAAALGQAEPRAEARSGLDAAGLGPARLPLLAARTTAAPSVTGSALALLVTARGIGSAGGANGSALVLALPVPSAGLPLPGQPLPAPAAITLLSTVPLLAALAAAWGARAAVPGATADPDESWASTASRVLLRGSRTRTPSGEPNAEQRDGAGVPGRAGLLGGTVLAAGGLLLAAGAARSAAVGDSAVSRGWTVRAQDLAASPLAAGWLLAAFGLLLAGPGLTALSGRLLGSVRPGPVRLLAGRSLVRDAAFLGRPLGGLSAVGAALVALARARLSGDGPLAPGPLLVLAAVLTGCCMAGAVLAALARARSARAPLRELLDRIGAPRKLGRAVTLLRAAVTSVVFTALAMTAGLLTALPPH
ncbi:hypothetical protein ACTWQF_00355 [Streptomyces sp. 8N114]|uniref:hypothetical protein n=1 Tax=Streptomyces sp. 8N114 TaxID=3457419 RepID=UPI003FD27C25